MDERFGRRHGQPCGTVADIWLWVSMTQAWPLKPISLTITKDRDPLQILCREERYCGLDAEADGLLSGYTKRWPLL